MTPARVIEGLRLCPNLTLSTDFASDNKATEGAFKNNPDKDSKLFFVNDLVQPKDEEDEPSMTLKEIVELAPGKDFVWTCCYNIPLRNETVLGARYGMNVIQYLRGGQMHATKTAPGGVGEFEINRGDIVNRAREMPRMLNRPATTKAANEYVNKLDSPMELPARR